ncbi:unnamed protein product [Prorocentrum cordatum]|uniref:Uncharacterized protein n=1 Tax=Prorocentrum cordatum TaxID=2364126 RepID=A0ABN9WRS8_9DINO|nr:unnamed protein product [Polarella glacialis]
MAPSASSVSCVSSAASSDERQPRHGYTVECKATFLHVVDDVEARLRQQRLSRSTSAPALVDALLCSSPSALGSPQQSQPRSTAQCQYQTQRKKHQRHVKKMLRRALADEPREGVVRL